jgi:hypothetical protein
VPIKDVYNHHVIMMTARTYERFFNFFHLLSFVGHRGIEPALLTVHRTAPVLPAGLWPIKQHASSHTT